MIHNVNISLFFITCYMSIFGNIPLSIIVNTTYSSIVLFSHNYYEFNSSSLIIYGIIGCILSILVPRLYYYPNKVLCESVAFYTIVFSCYFYFKSFYE